MENKALTRTRNSALVIQGDADVYRLAALVLSTLDRLDTTRAHEISRIRVIGRRVVIFDLPFLVYHADGRDLAVQSQLGETLTRLAVPLLIAVRPATAGSLLIFELAAATGPRHARSSLAWCGACERLMPYGHSH